MFSHISLEPCPLCGNTEFSIFPNSESHASAIYCTACPYGVEDSRYEVEELAEYHNHEKSISLPSNLEILSVLKKLCESIQPYAEEPQLKMENYLCHVGISDKFSCGRCSRAINAWGSLQLGLAVIEKLKVFSGNKGGK